MFELVVSKHVYKLFVNILNVNIYIVIDSYHLCHIHNYLLRSLALKIEVVTNTGFYAFTIQWVIVILNQFPLKAIRA